MADNRLGLALSGGGFRAAFFHLGVLAQMADQGLLRSVEVISTVSGGSIIGALYYLHVKRLLERSSDQDITDCDYQDIVVAIENDFLQAVQQNLRMRTFVNPIKNLKMSLPQYSRSDRIGELYDEYIYRRVLDSEQSTSIEMRNLKIAPKGDKPDFYPKDDNAKRSAKVPILLINATTLNTGHNWRFEASRMGEPKRDGRVESEVDKNMRLRRAKSYGDIVEKQQNFELGIAVAASAGVPGVFTPLAVSGLYGTDSEKIRVQLVDGGVHDNQGMQGLVDPDEIECTHLIVSDASGQLTDENEPGTGIPAVIQRANDILMERVRQEELARLLNDKTRTIALMHLRKGLTARAVAWNDKNGNPAGQDVPERASEPSENFGVTQQVQKLLSRVRTDLDSFSDIEAYSLMLDGYYMSRPELKKFEALRQAVGARSSDKCPRKVEWRFLAIAPWMDPSKRPDAKYLKHLDVASEKFFKVFKLSWPLTIITIAAVLVLLGVLWSAYGAAVQTFLANEVTYGKLLLAAGVFLAGFLAPRLGRMFKILSFIRAPAQLVVDLAGLVVVAVIGSWLVLLHLTIFDGIFKWCGRIQRLGAPPQK